HPRTPPGTSTTPSRRSPRTAATPLPPQIGAAGSHRPFFDLGLERSLAQPEYVSSVLFRNKFPALQRCLVVVSVLVRTLRQFHFLRWTLFVGEQLQDVVNAIQPGPLLVVGAQDVPRRPGGIGSLEHLITRP